MLKVMDIAIFDAKISIFFPEAELMCWVSFVYVIVTSYGNWHRENLRLDRENTGKTQGILKYNLSGYPVWGVYCGPHTASFVFLILLIYTNIWKPHCSWRVAVCATRCLPRSCSSYTRRTVTTSGCTWSRRTRWTWCTWPRPWRRPSRSSRRRTAAASSAIYRVYTPTLVD